MSTMIKLGVGADAIEVEDGTEVPLNGGSVRRGVVKALNHLILCHLPGGGVVRLMADGAFHPTPGEGPSGIDLAALRRERAPRVETVGCWGSGVPKCSGHYTTIYSFQAPPVSYPDYWTHRPGNTPEKQAAFDAALDAYVRDVGPVSDTYTPSNALITAARALGYGAKR